MSRTISWIVGGSAGAAAIAAGAAALSAATAFAGPAGAQPQVLAGAHSGPLADPDVAISGDALASASAAALAAVGGGTVTQTEVNDEESYYEVEVTFSQADIRWTCNSTRTSPWRRPSRTATAGSAAASRNVRDRRGRPVPDWILSLGGSDPGGRRRRDDRPAP